MDAVHLLMENDWLGTARVAVGPSLTNNTLLIFALIVKDYFDQNQQRMHLVQPYFVNARVCC